MSDAADLVRAAGWLRAADSLLITAGAGMGIDSGLPDFRGPAGLWAAYPALGRARIDFTEIANPAAFVRDPRLAWGFYGHRLALYRRTEPHGGFRELLELAGRMRHGAFVFTSNVDGQFAKAGFPAGRICEIHGSIHHLQCADGCGEQIWPADGFIPEIDRDACRLINALPTCPHCSALARPNILMFGDWGWVDRRSAVQHRRLADWLAGVERPVCIEIGAGTFVPSVRHFSESCAAPLIRINPDEADVPDPGTAIALRCGGREGIGALVRALAG